METRESVTDLLALAAAGDRAALDCAFPLVYEELRRLAHRQLRRESDGHTLSTTALVHEAYLKLAGVDARSPDGHGPTAEGRSRFFALAATAMRRILVDHARRHGAVKRGAARRPLPLEHLAQLPVEERAEFLVLLDDALERLGDLDARQARVVECRFFGGYTEEETAATLGIGLRTAKRDWAKARSWLYQELFPDALATGTPT